MGYENKQTVDLIFRYVIFCVVSTVANLLAQEIAVILYKGPMALVFSIFIGTGIGLIVKYILDKKYIFRYITQNIGHDSRLFVLYAIMGVCTTVIFWGFEFSFNWFFETKSMRYVGAVIGLAIGYLCKYFLDRKFVFVKPDNED